MNDQYYDKVKNAFNDWAGTYEEDVIPKLIHRGYSYSELGKEIAVFINEVEKRKPVVLELGTGTGVLGIEVVENCEKPIALYGLDISEKMIIKAMGKNIYQDFICTSADAYDFSAGFDIIYSSFMFHSVKEQELLINRVFYSLNIGGYFLMTDLVPNIAVQGFAQLS